MRIQFLLLSSIIMISSCQSEKDNSIVGTWNTVVESSDGYEYMEVHINDTAYIVISNHGVRYTALYQIQKDTLYHYVYDMYSISDKPFTIIDTVKFNYQIKNNFLNLTNIVNPESGSKWKLIKDENVTSITDLHNKPELREKFKNDFKQRYKESYIDTMKNKIEANSKLMFFDLIWEKQK